MKVLIKMNRVVISVSGKVLNGFSIKLEVPLVQT